MPLVRSQEYLDITIKTPLGENDFIVDAAFVDDGLSQTFKIELDLHSSRADIDFKKLLYKSITLSAKVGQKTIHFNGRVAHISLDRVTQDANGTLAFYKITACPHIEFLRLTKNYRIFQMQTTIDIIKKVLSDNEVSQIKVSTESCGKKTREYCVQYEESDLNFISRLMEEEGIFYYFEHDENNHTLVITDNHGDAKKSGSFSCAPRMEAKSYLDTVYNVRLMGSMHSKTFKSDDYDYTKSTAKLSVSTALNDGYGIVYEYPGLYTDIKDGESLVKHYRDFANWQGEQIEAETTIMGLYAGQSIALTEHINSTINTSFVIREIQHRFSQEYKSGERGTYRNTFLGFTSNNNVFRPAVVTPKPIAWSNQTAFVTGPDGEEVYCDKMGRIKVQFHWDQEGKKNESSSCWVRVMQNWAGKNWGGLVTPRIGMEVVVTFIGGNPDFPLVIGCVYNDIFTVPDYAESAPTKSTFKTNSSKGGEGFNELRFEDKKDSEEIYCHAQKDVVTVIENSRTETINTDFDKLMIEKGSKKVILNGDGVHYLLHVTDKGDVQTQIKTGNNTLEIEDGNHDITIKKGNTTLTLQNGNLTIKVTGNIEIESTGNMTFDAKGSISMHATQGVTIKSDTTLEVDAMTGMTLKSNTTFEAEAMASMTLKSNATFEASAMASMSLKSNAVLEASAQAAMNLSSSGEALVSGSVTTVKGDGLLALQGGAIMVG